MLVGSAVEYGCSFLQELILGSRSWDYSHLPFNLNGRICLLYSIFWGVLGVLWIKRLYPLMAKWILKIPNRMGKALTWVVFAFFVLNAAVTCLALARWIQRMDDIPPQNAFMQFVDERFTDERMEKIFPGMVFTASKQSPCVLAEWPEHRGFCVSAKSRRFLATRRRCGFHRPLPHPPKAAGKVGCNLNPRQPQLRRWARARSAL